MDGKRIREYGIVIGNFETGENNAITDVGFVEIGHSTIIKGRGKLEIGKGPVRTGVTVVLPHDGDLIQNPVEASYFVFNGAGTTAGLSLIDEYGLIETPIALTNTLSVGTVYQAIVKHLINTSFREKPIRWFNPVVGETSDAYLNDIGGLHVNEEHVFNAIESAERGKILEGNVGAGTGTSTMGYKAGIGTSSRKITILEDIFTVGVLVQSNFGGSITIKGVPIAKKLDKENRGLDDGSIMVIIATDAPLSYRQLRRVAKRGTLGLTRTGWSAGHGSGDYFISFSTSYRCNESANDLRHFSKKLHETESILDPLFKATSDATEEAILNSIFKAKAMVGRDNHIRKAIPIQKVLDILKKTRQFKQKTLYAYRNFYFVNFS